MDESKMVCYKLLLKTLAHLKLGRTVLVIYFVKILQIQ